MWWAVWHWTCSCIPRRRHRLSLASGGQIWIGGLWRCVVVGGSCSRLSGGRRSRRFPRSGWMARRCFPPHVYVDGELRSPTMDSPRGLIIIPQMVVKLVSLLHGLIVSLHQILIWPQRQFIFTLTYFKSVGFIVHVPMVMATRFFGSSAV
jgi:hypothetical protein